MNPHQKTFLVNAIIVACLFLSACGGQATAVATAPQTAVLSELQGSVEVLNPGEADFAPAAEGAMLEEGGQVRTGEDGRVRLDLSTGTLVRLAPNTSFLLESNVETDDSLATRIQLFAGQIWVILNGGSLDVDTPSGVAAVRGSYLAVRIDPLTMNVYVSCMEGECGAENESGSLEMFTGQGTILYSVEPGATPPSPETYQLTWEEFQEWAENVPEAAAILPDILATLTAFPTEAPVPTATPTPIPTPVQNSGAPACSLSLLTPANGTLLPETGSVTFTWSPQAGAASYQVTIVSSGGAPNSFTIPGTSLTRYIESLPAAGDYAWQVTALGTDGRPICATGPFSFTKPGSVVEPSLPTEPPVIYTGAGNTVFNLILGPAGNPIGECDQPYEVKVSDPDGISQVTLRFQVTDFYGNTYTSGAKGLTFDIPSSSWQTTLNPFSIPNDTIVWWFEAMDGLGNLTNSATYSYQETMFCVPPPDPNPTIFLSVTGPQGDPPAAPGCTQLVEATIQDDDGILSAAVFYTHYDSSMSIVKDAGSFNMTYSAGTWSAYLVITDSIPGDTFQWWIAVMDTLGNSVTTPGSYYYTETITCFVLP